MKRIVSICGGLLMAGLAAMTIGPASAQDDKVPEVKEVMRKLNKGPSALTPTLGKELRAGDPDWTDIQKQTKEFATMAAALEKNMPPKGSEESWKKLAKEYAKNAKALDDAARKKDKDAAVAAHKKLSNMTTCKTCHNAHR